jgi:hypothetical protein
VRLGRKFGLTRSRRNPRRWARARVEKAISTHLKAGNGILKVAALIGCGSATVQPAKKVMPTQVARALPRTKYLD